MNKLLGIFKYVSPSSSQGVNPKVLAKQIEKLRKVNRRMQAVSGPARVLDPVISRKLEQAKKP